MSLDPERDERRLRRERQMEEFALAGLLAAIQGSLGQTLPVEENGRELVRLARIVHSEVDHPTEAPPPENAPPPGDEYVADLVDELFEPK